MSNKSKLRSAAAWLSAGLALTSPAMAETGLSPVGPDAMYFTLFGGYVNSDGTATPGHSQPAGTIATILMEVEDGGFGGVTAGYVLGYPMPHGLTNFRIEASFAATEFDDDEASAAAGAVLDLDANATSVGPVTSKQIREVYDWSVAFKGDTELGPNTGAALGLEFFLRQSKDITFGARSNTPSFRSHKVDANFFGVMAVLQPEYAITQSLSLVADLGVGVYGVNASAVSITNVAAPLRFNDTASTVGFRGRANGGLKVKVMDAVSLTLFGGMDYWSDAPVADQQRFFGAPNALPTTRFNDLVELKAGLSLTVKLGGGTN